MNKQNKIRLILQNLLAKGKLTYSQTEIENIITKTLLLADDRSIEKWFTLMWKLELFTQPKPGTYQLFIPEAQKFDVKIDERQECLDVNL